MKCNQCGTDFEGKFCPNCGAPNPSGANSTQAQQSTPAYTQPVMQQPVQKPKKPIFKKWWFWVIIVVVVIAIAANLGGNSDKSPTKDTGSGTSSTTNTSSTKDETFGINDTAVFKSIKVTANELKESSGTDFFKPADGKTFVGVQFTIENTSDEDQAISSVLLFDAYVDGVKCDYSVTANCVFTDGTLDGTISAGKKMVGYYSVEVPSNWSELELQVKSSWLSSSKAAFVFNKQ